jgi:2,3-bisphosphoglycerate-dependent phosphoglycerate mutase
VMKKIVLLRHGESLWNKQNLFSGWTDVDLTSKGMEDARLMGHRLKEKNLKFDRAYSSVLKRAVNTLDIVLDEIEQQNIPIIRDWRLNERHYGKLQGKSKVDILDELSWEQLHGYRRGYYTRPAALESDDPRNAFFDPKYVSVPKELLPRTESLDDAYKRITPYLEGHIMSCFNDNENIIMSLHGNTLRVILKHFDKLGDSEIEGVEFAIGDILVYNLDNDNNIISKEHI